MEAPTNTAAVDQSLRKIARGGVLIFAGTVVSMAFQLLTRVLIVRVTTRSDYGLFSLGLVLFSMATAISQGGFSLSVPRYLGYYRGNQDEPRIRGVIRSSFEIQLLLGIALSLVFFLGSQYIEDFFNMEGLSTALRIFAGGIPFFNFIHITVNTFRGFDRVKPSLYFNDIMLTGLRLLFLFVVAVVAPSLEYVLIAYLSAFVCTALTAAGYYKKYNPVQKGESVRMRKELFLFSLPLFGTVFVGQLMKWTDVLMLGRFTSADMVGLYNGAIPICLLIPIFLSSAGFIFVPVLSALYSQGHLSEMKKTYAVITKWIFSATLPLFLVIFVFPQPVLTFLFRAEYQEASTALRILSTGYMFHVLMGPVGQNLVIFGRPRLIMINNCVGLVINIMMNWILIPLYGINGAATATALMYVGLNLMALFQVYRISGMHPFSRNYVKPLLSSLGLVVVFSAAFEYVFTVPYWTLPFVFALFVGSYFLIIVVTRSFDREDIMLLKTLEKRVGIDLSWLRKILGKLS
ncbi:MAG: flippase [Theionarchaea archaeon]|nr:flippase [Theionarchaea archaeon]